MAFPLKIRGLRRIVVDGTEFRLVYKAWVPDSHLLVYADTSTMPLQVVLCKWMDHRAMYPFLMPNTPETLGPAFVRQAIEFSLQNGWRYAERGAPFRAQWNGQVFSVSPQ